MTRGTVIAFWGVNCVLCMERAKHLKKRIRRPKLAVDIHEVFITRGRLPGHIELLREPINAIPVCRPCHDWAQYTPAGKAAARRIILQSFSKDKVLRFVEELGMKTDVLLKEVENEMSDLQ